MPAEFFTTLVCYDVLWGSHSTIGCPHRENETISKGILGQADLTDWSINNFIVYTYKFIMMPIKKEDQLLKYCSYS